MTRHSPGAVGRSVMNAITSESSHMILAGARPAAMSQKTHSPNSTPPTSCPVQRLAANLRRPCPNRTGPREAGVRLSGGLGQRGYPLRSGIRCEGGSALPATATQRLPLGGGPFRLALGSTKLRARLRVPGLGGFGEEQLLRWEEVGSSAQRPAAQRRRLGPT
jgi:hypothetical protein